MEIKKLNAARGWLWIKQGFQLIMLNPHLSILSALSGVMIIFFAMLVPGIGSLLAVLLMPFFLASFMRICRALEENEKFDPAQLLVTLKQRASGLLSLGALLMLGLFLVSALMVSVGGETFTKLMQEVQTTENPQVLMDAISTAGTGVAAAILLGFTLVVVLLVSWQYAPILVFFSGVSPYTALYASLLGTARNILPYTVYGLVLQLFALVLGILPYGLGMLVLLPLTLTSLYVSYRNIFPWLDAASQPPEPIKMEV
ncbi:MAG: BPSS1780 family membrane protein [Sideroxydans sp.]|nr:BPSS1780 family membrane protein [Sideroxydans sp.]